MRQNAAKQEDLTRGLIPESVVEACSGFFASEGFDRAVCQPRKKE